MESSILFILIQHCEGILKSKKFENVEYMQALHAFVRAAKVLIKFW